MSISFLKNVYIYFRIPLFLITVGFSCILLTIFSIIFGYKRTLIIQPRGEFNTQKRNPNLINQHSILVIHFSLVVIIFTSLYFPFDEWLETDWFFSKRLPSLILIGVISPTFFYVLNPQLRRFYVRLFWEKAPNFFQQYNPDRVIEIVVWNKIGIIVNSRILNNLTMI